MIYFTDVFVYFKQTCGWVLPCSAHHSGESVYFYYSVLSNSDLSVLNLQGDSVANIVGDNRGCT